MSLDITFKRMRDVRCPHCGEIVKQELVDSVDSGGKVWYDMLEKLGYYTPTEKRDKDYVDVWYGENMELTQEQTEMVFNTLPKNPYNVRYIEKLIALTIARDDHLVINADW